MWFYPNASEGAVDMTRQRKSAGGKNGRWKRILGYTGIGLGVVVLAAGGFGLYEYNHLQPKQHFNNLTDIGQANQTGNKVSNSNGPTPTGTLPAGTFNVLLLGSDARPTASASTLSDTASHTDSMILVHVNLVTHQYSMLSIPRDTRVDMPGYGHTKLTSVQILAQTKYGTQQGYIYTVKAISQLVGVPINYYAETNYWGLQSMVDAIGGINMDLPFPVTLTHAWYPQDEGKKFSAGTHFVDGQMATEIVHERYSVPGTDYGRQQLQEAALVGIAKAAMKPSNIMKLPQLSKAVHQYLMTSNMTTQDLVSLGLGVKGNFHPQTQLHYYQIKGKNEKLYNDPLGAYDDEIVLNMAQLHALAKAHFEN